MDDVRITEEGLHSTQYEIHDETTTNSMDAGSENSEIEVPTIAPQTIKLVGRYIVWPVLDIPDHCSKVMQKNSHVGRNPRSRLPWFTACTITRNPIYEDIYGRIEKGEELLEINCGLGQNLRQLVDEGFSAENLCGVDEDMGLIMAGNELFMEGDPAIMFLARDLLNPSEFGEVRREFDIVFSSMWYHQFHWAQQFTIAKRLVRFLKREPLSTFFGQQIGHVAPRLYQIGRESGRWGYAHDVTSLQQLWDEVGEETDSSWLVKGVMEYDKDIAAFMNDRGARCLKFWICRMDIKRGREVI